MRTRSLVSSTTPNRSAYIALLQNEEGDKSYILAPVGLKDGDKVYSGKDADIKPGNTLPIANIPVGTMIHNIEIYPGKGAQLVRSAGAFAQLMAKENGSAQVRLPSGEVRIIRLDCKATIGQVGNLEHENINIGKAGNGRTTNGVFGCFSLRGTAIANFTKENSCSSEHSKLCFGQPETIRATPKQLATRLTARGGIHSKVVNP